MLIIISVPNNIMNKKRDFIKKTEREEEAYLRNVKSTKPRDIRNRPLYELCENNNYTEPQEGGFLSMIPMLLRMAGPFIIDYALNKFTGNGFGYTYNDGSELDDDHKKAILMNILYQHPHLANKIFQ